MRKNRAFCIIFLSLFLATPFAAIGQSLQLEFDPDFNRAWYGVSFNGTSAYHSVGNIIGYDPNSDFETYLYCVEYDQNISVPGLYDFDVASVSPTKWQQAAWLLQTYGDLLNGTARSAALQLAIWEVIHETQEGFNLFGGSFGIVSGPFRRLLDHIQGTFLNETTFTVDMQNFAVYTDETYQDLLGYANVNPVPEPATMILFGAGLAGVAGWRMRRARQG